VQFSLKNTGSVDGSEIVQVYLGFPSSAGEPPKQLKGFQKVDLAAGGEASVSVPLNDRSMSIWDESTHDWAIVSGTFNVYVGASSSDMRLSGSFQV